MEKLSWTKRTWTSKHALENCGVGKTPHKWNTQQDTLCPRCHERVEDAQHAFKCEYYSNQESKRKMIGALKEKLEELDTSEKISRAMISGVKHWLHGAHGVNPNTFSLAAQRAFRDQTRIGWCNLVVGFLVGK